MTYDDGILPPPGSDPRMSRPDSFDKAHDHWDDAFRYGFMIANRWRAPEYHPPPRTEAWLTLPPGVVVARDDPEWMPRTIGSMPRYPQVRSEVARRFRDEFGNRAAQHWDLEPDPHWLMNETMKAVWTDSRISKQFYSDMPALFPAYRHQHNDHIDVATSKVPLHRRNPN